MWFGSSWGESFAELEPANFFPFAVFCPADLALGATSATNQLASLDIPTYEIVKSPQVDA